MSHLIIYAHPNQASFNNAILQEVIKASSPHSVVVRDLYQLGFDPRLDWQELSESFSQHYPAEIQQEHQYWAEAKVITLIYPLWWMGFPAILKGYLDRVLSYGFAYQNATPKSIGLLDGKKIQQFITLGNSVEEYRNKGYLAAFEHSLGKGLFEFCGIEQVQLHFFGEIGLPTTDYAKILAQVTACTRSFLS